MSFSPLTFGSGIAGYNFLARTRDTQQNLMAQSPQVKRETDNFVTQIQDIKTSDQLLDNRSVLKVALGAFGLDDDLNNRAFIKQVLESDLSDSTSLANRLADKQYLALAKAFNFSGDGGPSTFGVKTGDEVLDQLKTLKSADDLLNDRALLSATLKTFDLGQDVKNTYFLKQVLESDPADANSFVNRLGDPSYVALATAFDFSGKESNGNTVFSFAQVFSGQAENIKTVDDLFDKPDLLNEALRVFGLEDDQYQLDFLRSVLESDTGDDSSVANSRDDPRYSVLADAFGFAEREKFDLALANNPNPPFPSLVFESKLEKFVKTVSAQTDPLNTPEDFFNNFKLMVASYDFFDVPFREDQAKFVNSLFTSDRSDPVSRYNTTSDTRYRALADGFNFEAPEVEQKYPPGFTETVVQNYLDRQFEIQVGEQEPAMRFALALGPELTTIAESGASENGKWYAVMASQPLREVFETIFGLPSSFGVLDVDRQLGDLKAKSERMFGTSNLSELVTPERVDEVRRRYLAQSALAADSVQSSASLALTLLSIR
ncbi:DUF1217 domain-containing protein [Yoonia sp. MH D7]